MAPLLHRAAIITMQQQLLAHYHCYNNYYLSSYFRLAFRRPIFLKLFQVMPRLHCSELSPAWNNVGYYWSLEQNLFAGRIL